MTVEAQNLTGQHRGHHATYQTTGTHAGNQTHAGTIVQVKHLGDGQTTIVTRGLDGMLGWAHVPAETPVTVTPASSQPAYAPPQSPSSSVALPATRTVHQ